MRILVKNLSIKAPFSLDFNVDGNRAVRRIVQPDAEIDIQDIVTADDVNKIRELRDAVDQGRIIIRTELEEKDINLTPPTYDDLRVSLSDVSLSGAGTDPTPVTWKTVLWLFEFKTDDSMVFIRQIPHEYKQNTNLRIHLHWTPRDRGIAESGKTVNWKADVTFANINGVFPDLITLDLTDTCTGVNDSHLVTTSKTVDVAANLKISAMIIGRVYRAAGDTWVGTGPGGSPSPLDLDFHFLKDGFGSRLEYTKDL